MNVEFTDEEYLALAAACYSYFALHQQCKCPDPRFPGLVNEALQKILDHVPVDEFHEFCQELEDRGIVVGVRSIVTEDRLRVQFHETRMHGTS